MDKTFEDLFTEYQTDMISIAMEYADYREEVDTIYVYGSYENGSWECNYFLKVNGQIVHTNKMNEALAPGARPFDVSRERQSAALDIMTDDYEKIIKLCREYGRKMPTEMRIVYYPKTNRADANYRYDPVCTKDPDNMKIGAEVMEDWMAEEAAKLGQAYKRLIG